MTKYDVTGVGNAIVDILAQVDESFLQKHGLVKASMTLIDEKQASALYEDMPPAIEKSGGSAANTMAGIASFGGKAAFIGKVKDDDLGKIFAHDLRSIGVHYSTKPAIDGVSTAKCLISITPDAERTMATYLGATREIHIVDIDEDVIANSKVTYLEGYLWDEQHAKNAMRRSVEIAKKNGKTVALSLSDAFCVGRHREGFLTLIREGVDIVFANEAEIKCLFEDDNFDSAIEKARGLTEIVAVTRGAKGSVILNGDITEEILLPSGLIKVVDTTGAGDLYASGFLYGYTQGKNLAKCGRLATIAASEVIQHIGARPEENLAGLAKKVA
jgi:sugar/nucleoside kinase (ribokinase family)